MTTGNVATHLREASQNLPNEKAIASSNPKGFPDRSFLELYRDVKACASRLQDKGIGKGDKTLLFVRPGYELIVYAFSLFFLGAVPVIIDPGMGMKSILSCIRTTRPSHLVGIPVAHWMSRVFRKSFESVQSRIKVETGIGSFSSFSDEKLLPVESHSEELAAIVFTSGSTGPPKGVCYKHKTFNGQINLLREHFGMAQGEVDMTTLPIFALFNPALGITTVMPEINPSRPAKASARSLVQTLLDYKITTAFASPIIGRKIAEWCKSRKIELPHVKRFFLAGAPSPPQLIDDLASVVKEGEILVPYGSTEALPVSYCNHETIKQTREETEEGLGSCLGKPLDGISVKLFPISSSPFGEEVEELKDGRVGEICVAGPIVTEEYHRMPGATLDSKFSYSSSLYHRMGDLGYFDGNKNLRFLGRKAERITTLQGVLETERVEPIVNAIDGVRRSALIGIGNRAPVQACIVVESRKDSQDPEAKERIRAKILEKLRSALPKFVIGLIIFEKSLPVDARHNAKIHRLHLSKKWTRKLIR